MKDYSIRKVSPGIVEIHDETDRFRVDEQSLLEAIAGMKDNKAAYTDPVYYERALKMYEDALDVLRGS